ncbi:MAG: LysR family transcriptional regulator [Solirubrobacteraceae bacterium]
MLDLKRLRVLRAVADAGSFSAAADQLSYTQSAVSQQIAALERETGLTLVDRGGRGGVRLTDAGAALVAHADAIFARVTAAEQELEDIAGVRGGRMRLASFPTAGATLVPLALRMFAERHPGVELSLIEAQPEAAVPRLKAGEIDVVLTFEYTNLHAGPADLADLDVVHLFDDPMYVALPRDHPAARRPSVRLADLADEAWIHGDCTGICGRMHIAACEAAGFEPRVQYETDDYNVAQGLVAAGIAVTLIPELALTNVRDDIAIRDLGRKAPIRRILAATLAGSARSPATGAMIGVLREAADEYAASRTARLAGAA